MKRILLLATLFAISAAGAQAQSLKKDPDSYHVIITLANGEKVDGYLKSGWHAENSLLKKENYSFKVIKDLQDKEPVKYTAEEVLSVEYTDTTEANPDGIRWESRPLASPGIGDRYRTIPRLLCVDKEGENATIYWWKVWVWGGINNSQRRLATFCGIRFHNDPENIVYPYDLVTTMLMDKNHPGLKEFCKNWFKGPEGKVRKKESRDDETWILDMYDAYLASTVKK